MPTAQINANPPQLANDIDSKSIEIAIGNF